MNIPTGKIVTGWKGIAKHLQVSVRTAKRYHYVYSMPVRRLPGRLVAIIPDEITEWLIEFSDLSYSNEPDRIKGGCTKNDKS